MEKRAQFRLYRKKQRYKALVRDEFQCMVCRYLGLPKTAATEVHHVYGRGNWKTRDIYEHYRMLISICRAHHHDYHFVRKTTDKQLMEKVLKYANERQRGW